MNELMLEIFEQASMSGVIIDDDLFNISFNTIIYDDNKMILNTTKNEHLPTLIIKNKSIFNKKLSDYVVTVLNKRKKFPTFASNKEYNKTKFIISYLFANATAMDFVNPLAFIDRNINYLLDDTFDTIEDGMQSDPLDFFQNSSIFIESVEQSLFMETPQKFNISLVKKIENSFLNYDLPSISCAISADDNGRKTCYVYSLQNVKEKKIAKSEEQLKYEKKISRELYKINAGVFESESDEYKAYKNNESDYYPENISDVTPSAVISATLLIGLLTKLNVHDIKIVDFLPVRWHAKDQSITKFIEANKDLTISDKIELRDKQQQIQENITEKFLRTFRRVAYHFNGLEIQSFPKEGDDYMSIHLNDNNDHCNNPILQQIFEYTKNIEFENIRHK